MSLDDVNPFIGVEEEGNCLCGPFLPHSMVRLGPDTAPPQSTNGYKSHMPIIGFSHTHLSGTGGQSRFGNIRVTPYLGVPRLQWDPQERGEEEARVGYYRVRLAPSGIEAELTTTARVGVHRYRFPDGAAANLFFDVGAVVQTRHCAPVVNSGGSIGGWCEYASSRELIGRGDFCGGWGHQFPYSVYFYAVWDVEPEERMLGTHQGIYKSDAVHGANCRASVRFAPGAVVNLRVGISFVSVAKARASVERETGGGADFETVRARHEAVWAGVLGALRVEGGTADQRALFHTSHYRVRCMPGDLGIDDEFPLWHSGARQFSDYIAIWDSARNANSLIALTDPKCHADLFNCLLDVYRHTGWIPDVWVAAHSAQVQGGSLADVIFCESALKKIPGIDYGTALEGMRKNAEVESPNPKLYGRHVPDYRDLGFVSTRIPYSCVSFHIEYAYQDWCIGRLAQELGQGKLAERYFQESRKVWNLWRDDLLCFGPRNPKGEWINPFDPAGHAEPMWLDPYFYEGTSRQWSVNVQHDFHGLARRCGGAEGFAAYLDRYFDEGHFWLKEAWLHAPYLYLYAGRPDRTAERVRACLAEYKAARTGLPDNEDMGSQSSFYVWSSLGLYPLMGQDVYWLNAPAFAQVEIDMPQSGRTLRVETSADPETHPYVAAAELNGKPLDRAWLRHAELIEGGTLRYTLAEKPQGWGRDNLPPNGLA